MTGQNRTLPILDEIKRIARLLKKESGEQHAMALDRAAVLNGFHNYRHAYNISASKPTRITPKASILPPKFQISVTQYWADRKLGLRGKETLQITLAKPLVAITSPSVLN